MYVNFQYYLGLITKLNDFMYEYSSIYARQRMEVIKNIHTHIKMFKTGPN